MDPLQRMVRRRRRRFQPARRSDQTKRNDLPGVLDLMPS
jgi:hypothetical protein